MISTPTELVIALHSDSHPSWQAPFPLVSLPQVLPQGHVRLSCSWVPVPVNHGRVHLTCRRSPSLWALVRTRSSGCLGCGSLSYTICSVHQLPQITLHSTTAQSGKGEKNNLKLIVPNWRVPRKLKLRKEGELATEREGRSREVERLSSLGMGPKTFLILKIISPSFHLVSGTNERVSPFSISALSLWCILKDKQIDTYAETLWHRSERGPLDIYYATE